MRKSPKTCESLIFLDLYGVLSSTLEFNTRLQELSLIIQSFNKIFAKFVKKLEGIQIVAALDSSHGTFDTNC